MWLLAEPVNAWPADLLMGVHDHALLTNTDNRRGSPAGLLYLIRYLPPPWGTTFLLADFPPCSCQRVPQPVMLLKATQQAMCSAERDSMAKMLLIHSLHDCRLVKEKLCKQLYFVESKPAWVQETGHSIVIFRHSSSSLNVCVG